MLPKLSKAKCDLKHFCYCDKCNKGWENDVHTSHPKCPKCGVWMVEMQETAILNLIARVTVQRDKNK
jgi:Zn finger protein HypA/HybF involved in hydrogenase expression